MIAIPALASLVIVGLLLGRSMGQSSVRGDTWLLVLNALALGLPMLLLWSLTGWWSGLFFGGWLLGAFWGARDEREVVLRLQRLVGE